MNVTGKTMIFKGDYGYSTTISSKNKEGQYENMYLTVQLPKGIELENKTMIEITNGFLSFYKSKEGLPKIKLVITKFTTDQEEQYINEEREAIQNEQNYYNNQEDDLPF